MELMWVDRILTSVKVALVTIWASQADDVLLEMGQSFLSHVISGHFMVKHLAIYLHVPIRVI